ncbi:hypothetical protein K1719_004470 [Acacia pycnantha]|nr:hypothetical protein K1719_004470 [Acacia pycnantha]
MRSSKKIKNGSNEGGKNVLQGDWPKLGSRGIEFSKGGPSFAEKLKGKNGQDDSSDEEDGKMPYDNSENNMLEDEQGAEDNEPLCNMKEDLSHNFPIFSFFEKMKKRQYRAWRKAVIVKLLDRSIKYKALLSWLQTLWAKKGVVSLINIGHGFYVVKLSNKDDYINSLTRAHG